MKRLALLLCLVTLPLFAQSGQQPPMAGMNMDHSSPPQLSVPPPELLQDIAGHAPLKLEAFLAMADHNNPTLQQAAAMIRRSEAEARQAGLYPNPTVGYEGDQIRGGSYGGGEQGGFVAQNIVLGGKLGLRRNIYEQQKQSDTIAVL
jgi:cobalt-zinc-cadmium efflux system outer membrane protein